MVVSLVDRETATIIMTVISFIFTYLCLFNIAEFYLKLQKYKIYLKNIEIIIDDKKINSR